MTDPLVLFSDRGCPYAHRVLALVEHLGRTVERSVAEIGDKPDGVFDYTASGRIPLLVDDGLVIHESRVMIEYLADRHELTNAYPADLAERHLHKNAMALVDDFLAERAFRPVGADERPRLQDALDGLEAATATGPPQPSLLLFHVAPFWLRFRWWWPVGEVVQAVEARPALRAWLDEAISHDSITATAPDPAALLADLERARDAGLVPAAVVCAITTQTTQQLLKRPA